MKRQGRMPEPHEKFQPRLSANKKFWNVVNTRPADGTRSRIVGFTLSADAAIKACEGMNQMEKQISKKLPQILPSLAEVRRRA